MSGTDVGLALSVFLACTVEAVEALTIVLAVGTTRSWRSTLLGLGGALTLLAAVTVALGPGSDNAPDRSAAHRRRRAAADLRAPMAAERRSCERRA